MLALVNVVLLVGYLLVYAAIAHHGKYAAKPWDALREPLGAGSGDASSSSASSGGGAGSVLGKIARGAWDILNPTPFFK